MSGFSLAAPKKRGPRAYKLPESIPAGEILKDLYKKEWKLGPTVGKGGFGELYLGEKILENLADSAVSVLRSLMSVGLLFPVVWLILFESNW